VARSGVNELKILDFGFSIEIQNPESRIQNRGLPMASPFQQQARQRKLIYIGLILALFTLSLVWRSTVIARQADQLALREEKRGEVDMIGSLARQVLTGGFRGPVIVLLWNEAQVKQKKNQWNELEYIVRALTKLQPHFTTPWLFQSWNLAYNVSVECDRVRDKYFYISRGIELLGEGERQNRDNPDLRWNIGFYTQHKICQSDERNYHRSLFQLSLIPPNERDPARFWKMDPQKGEPVFNNAEFRKFVEAHPQLIRRLRVGITMFTTWEKKQQFTCETPQDVVQFLDDNFQVPSIYRVPEVAEGDRRYRVWDPNKSDEMLSVLERFPVLPPPHAGAFDADALTTESSLVDSTDAYAASHAWFCYAQEPLPSPDVLPGSSQPISDRVHQRRPKHMTTLIFRNYPCQGRRYMAERLQEEGWYDDEPWDTGDWFDNAPDESVRKSLRLSLTKDQSSLGAWQRALLSWEKHGRDNHLIFDSPAHEKNTFDLAMRFGKRFGMNVGAAPPRLNADELSPSEKAEYEAAQFVFEYQFYRSLSNYPHHLIVARVEAKPETVACRKLFYQAEYLHLKRSPSAALEVYRNPVNLPAWGGYTVEDPVLSSAYTAAWAVAGPHSTVADCTLAAWLTTVRTKQTRPPNPLEAWREIVLLRNKDFRGDHNIQEGTAEIQVRYVWLFNRRTGKDLKEDIGKMAKFLPLVPKFNQDHFRPPIFMAPFDYKVKEVRTADGRVGWRLLPFDDREDGTPLIEPSSMDVTLDRMHLPGLRRRPASGPPEGMRMPAGRQPPSGGPPGPGPRPVPQP
jgi:hypothetical protein